MDLWSWELQVVALMSSSRCLCLAPTCRWRRRTLTRSSQEEAKAFLTSRGLVFSFFFFSFVLLIDVNYLCTVLHIYFKLYKYARWQ